MSNLICLSCGASTTNGLVLCELCRRKVLVVLEFLPVYFRNLARWRPGRAGSRRVPGYREPRASVVGSDRVSQALEEAGNDLTTWARSLADDRRELSVPRPQEAIFGDLRTLVEADVIALLCAGFERHLTSIATLEWCGQFASELNNHEAVLRQLTERVAPGWYAGACRCGAPTYVVPGLTWMRCRNCGITTYAQDHLATVLTEARGWVAPPMRIAEAIVALVDTEASVTRLHKRISKWGERERITVIRDHDYAPKRYRLGEVLDALGSEGPTTVDQSIDTQAS